MRSENAEIVLAPERGKGGFGVSQELDQEVVKCVIFTQADIDLLRLLRWGRHILPESLAGTFPQRVIEDMAGQGYLKLHEKSGSFVLTAKGNQLLSGLLSQLPPDTPPSYRPAETQRRIRLSKLLMTGYRGSVRVFTTDVGDLSATPSLFLPAIVRGRGHNPWGSTRVAALAHLGNLLCAIHYVYPGAGKVALTDELTSFNNHTARFSEQRRCFLFTGDTYTDVLKELDAAGGDTDKKLISYGDAYRVLRLPVHLLSCDETGAVQLQVMATPDYRRRYTMAALKSSYQPPPEDKTQWDAIFQGAPFVMAADMDLRRIDAAWRDALEVSCSQIGIVALEKQISVLRARYPKAHFYLLKEATLAEVLGHPPKLYVPPGTQYLTEKGETVYAPFVQAHGKAGGHHCP